MATVQMKKKPVMQVQDMTEGNPIKLLLNFAIPLFIGNIFQQIYSMVDTMVVGYQLGDSAIAAIGATSALYSLIIDFASGMNNGFGFVVTRCFGAHNERNFKQSIAGMLMLNTSISVIITTIVLLFLRPLLEFLNTPEEIFEQAYLYIFIICAGMIGTVYYNMFAAILRAVGNSRSPLYFLMLSSILNIGLDVLFVITLQGGVAGAAIATVLAQAVSAILCGIYVVKNYREILPGREEFHISKIMLTDLLTSGFSVALMYCVVDVGSVIFQRANNALGEMIIAAHTAARRIIVMLMQPVGTLAMAYATFVGQNWGAGKVDRIQSTMKKVFGLEILWSIVACAMIFAFGAVLVRFTTGVSNVEIVENAVLSMRLHLVFFPALGILNCIRLSMQAMGYKMIPIISSCIELCMKIFSANWMIPTLGFLGTCLTEPITWALMMIFLLTAYLLLRKKMFGERT